jgi:hypothetical protein
VVTSELKPCGNVSTLLSRRWAMTKTGEELGRNCSGDHEVTVTNTYRMRLFTYWGSWTNKFNETWVYQGFPIFHEKAGDFLRLKWWSRMI